MKTKKILLFFFCALTFGFLSTSCEDDDYTSLPPTFSDMTFKTLDSEVTELRAGDRIVATCEQSKKGHLLNLTKYTWSANGEGVNHRYKKVLEAGYDNESQHPTDTLVFTNPGVYQLTFQARYNTSAETTEVSRVEKIENGKITYKTASFMYYDVIIEKRITVK